MAGRICAVCRQTIGGPDGRDNVAVIRWVRLLNGKSGWIAMHVRCVGKPWPTEAERAATPRPPGKPLQLPMIDMEVDHGV